MTEPRRRPPGPEGFIEAWNSADNLAEVAARFGFDRAKASRLAAVLRTKDYRLKFFGAARVTLVSFEASHKVPAVTMNRLIAAAVRLRITAIAALERAVLLLEGEA